MYCDGLALTFVTLSGDVEMLCECLYLFKNRLSIKKMRVIFNLKREAVFLTLNLFFEINLLKNIKKSLSPH